MGGARAQGAARSPVKGFEVRVVAVEEIADEALECAVFLGANGEVALVVDPQVEPVAGFVDPVSEVTSQGRVDEVVTRKREKTSSPANVRTSSSKGPCVRSMLKLVVSAGASSNPVAMAAGEGLGRGDVRGSTI